MVDEISEAILRRFEVDAKSLTISSGAAETRRAMRLTPEPDTAAASPESWHRETWHSREAERRL